MSGMSTTKTKQIRQNKFLDVHMLDGITVVPVGLQIVF